RGLRRARCWCRLGIGRLVVAVAAGDRDRHYRCIPERLHLPATLDRIVTGRRHARGAVATADTRAATVPAARAAVASSRRLTKRWRTQACRSRTTPHSWRAACKLARFMLELDGEALALVSGGNRFTEAAGRVLNLMGRDSINGGAAGSIVGALLGGVG